MAVIRQQTQVFNQPIGVVRADAADDAVGRAIAGAASDLANLAYREATIEAEQAGVESAGAASRTNIVTIDPVTGRPVAYKPPSNFGRLAARSYQNMIDRRFEESINDEIKERGAEIANTSTSAAQYRDRMSEYVKEMYSNAVGEDGELNNYGRFIEETGTAYVASTFATMREREAKAAREALIRQQNMQAFMGMREISELILTNANPEEVTARIDSETQRLNELYNTGAISLSTFSSRLDQLDGYTSQIADSRLINIYSALPEDSPLRPKLSAALRNPQLIPSLSSELNIPNLNQIIIEAKMNGDVGSLISSMTAQAGYLGEYEESVVDQYARDIDITPYMSFDEILVATLNVPQEFREAVTSELTGQWAAQVLNLEAMDENDVDRITNELRNAGQFSFGETAQIAGRDVANQLSSMSQDQRNALAEQLSGRRAALNSISSEETNQNINNLRAQIRTASADGTLTEEQVQNNIRFAINSADIDEGTKSNLQGVLDTMLVSAHLETARKIDGISHNLMSAMRDAVRSSPDIQEAFVATLDDDQRTAFEAYRDAYRIEPATANSSMGDRIAALDNITQDNLRAIRVDSIKSAIELQLGVSKEDLEFIDEEIFGNLGPINASQAIQNETLLEYANLGYALPTFVKAIETGLRSRNEADVVASLQLFETYSNLTAEVENGRTQRLDILRSELPEQTYALLSAVSIVARSESRPPLDVMLELQSLEESPDALIRSDLGLSSNAPLRNLFAEYPMSSNYREEILAMMRVRRARGEVFTEDLVGEIIRDYTSKQDGLGSDDAVFGPYIGDETVYARANYFSQGEILANRNELFDLMSEDPSLSQVMRGGTSADQVLQGFRSLLGLNITGRSAAAFEGLFPSVFGSEASEKMSDRDRLAAGLQVVGFELKYNPVVEAFNRGQAVYQVGYVQNGAFQPILINGEPFMLEQGEDAASSFETNRALNNYIAARNGGANAEQIRLAEFEYLRSLGHMTDDMLRDRGFADLMEDTTNED